MAVPVLYLLAGPNGSGKSTFFEHVIHRAAPRLVFVNADEIERRANLGGEPIDSYEASARAALWRRALIDQRRSFATETVFSHESKVELVRSAIDAGYIVNLHVLIAPLDLAIARVRERAELGGHDVGLDKMRARYGRLWRHVAEATEFATETTVWDSSGFSKFVKVALFDNGRLVGEPRWPAWAPTELVGLR